MILKTKPYFDSRKAVFNKQRGDLIGELASSAGGPGFNPQSRTPSYQRRYKNGTSSALV